MTDHRPLALILAVLLSVPALAADWPMWGRDAGRNMAADVEIAPATFDPGTAKPGTEEIDMSTTRNVKWVAKLGSQAYGNPTVGGGRVLVGTNNESPRDPRHKGDRGVVMCFNEADGAFLWQLVVPKLGAGKVSDWEYLGICSSPLIDGDRIYVVTNRCEVVCLDLHGMANGNDGPFMDEGVYMADAGRPPMEPGPLDADIIWRFDMREELGVFPHNIASSSILLVGDRLYATTSNGQDWSHVNIPSPLAPTVCVLDKNTGELLGEEASGISERLYHCNWSSPAFGVLSGRPTVVFGAGDGFCYGFDPEPIAGAEGYNILKELWRFDCNPPHYKEKDGKPLKYPAYDGPSEIISTPVLYHDKVYAAIGQDPEHGDGVGALSCIRPADHTGDITAVGKAWMYTDLGRTISTPSIVDGLLFIAEYDGDLHCLDAETGAVHWVHETRSRIWGSTFVAGGNVYLGTEDGTLVILAANREKQLINVIEFNAPIYSTPIFANGVLYVGTQTHLYAIAED